MTRAHIILVPAVLEGWGLVVTEANAMGTPAIGYDFPGLRDSIRHGKTGINVMEKSHVAMAREATSLLEDSNRLLNYSRNALEFSRQFNWDKTVESFQKVLDKQSEANVDVIVG